MKKINWFTLIELPTVSWVKVKPFTLIELLVVIAIISILMAVLLPSLKKAKDQANKIFCTSNLAQKSKALLMYCGDYNEIIPNDAGGLVNHLYLRPETGDGKGADKLYCPKNTRGASYFEYWSNRVDIGSWKGWHSNAHYGTNFYMSYYDGSGNSRAPSITINKIKQPVITIWIGEIRTWGELNPTTDTVEWWMAYPWIRDWKIRDTYSIYVDDPRPFRHNLRDNYLFLDSHVESLFNPKDDDHMVNGKHVNRLQWEGYVNY